MTLEDIQFFSKLRLNVKTILADPEKRRELFVRCIYSMRAMDDPTMTRERAEQAYDRVQEEKKNEARNRS